jgi:hypothetical protein
VPPPLPPAAAPKQPPAGRPAVRRDSIKAKPGPQPAGEEGLEILGDGNVEVRGEEGLEILEEAPPPAWEGLDRPARRRTEPIIRRPVRRQSSKAGLVAGIVAALLLAGGAPVAVYFLVLRDGGQKKGPGSADRQVALADKGKAVGGAADGKKAEGKDGKPPAKIDEPPEMKEPPPEVEQPPEVKQPPPKVEQPPEIKQPPPKVEEPPAQPAPKEPGPKEPGPVAKDPGDGAVKAPRLDQDKVVKMLPAAADDVVVGGAGRYVILRLPTLRKLAVFDVSTANVAGFVPVAAGDAKVAAGLDKLVVAAADGKLERWDLKTLRKEADAPLPGGGTVTALSMGSASEGPVLVFTKTGAGPGSATFLDLMTLGPAPYRLAPGGRIPPDAVFVRASADGSAFGMRQGVGGEPHQVALALLQGKQAVVRTAGDLASSVLVPGPDGRRVYTGTAVYDDQLKLLLPKPPPQSFAKPFVPAAEGPYYMRLDFKEWDKVGGSLTFFAAGHDRPLVQLDDVEGATNEQVAYGKLRDTLSHDQRVHFILDAKVVVGIPPGNDRLVLRRFDMDEELAKSREDYLFVASQAPTAATRGAAFRFQLAVKSRKGGLKYRLDSGPQGMKVSPAGLVTWDVPADYAERDVSPIISITDAGGQEIFYAFRLDVPAAAADMPAPGELEKVVKELPAPASDVAVGGGGRFLILHLPKLQQLAVFDVSKAELVGSVPVVADEVKFTAGQDKLIVVLPATHVLERWGLSPLRREAQGPAPATGKVTGVLMGSASEGPLLVSCYLKGTNGKIISRLLDPLTLRPLSTGTPGNVLPGGMDAFEQYRVSADGTVFATWKANATPQGLGTLVRQGTSWKPFYQPISVAPVLPGPDGRFLYTGQGVYTNQGQPTGTVKVPTLPAAQGPFYLALGRAVGLPGGLGGKAPGQAGEEGLSVHIVGEPKAIVTFPPTAVEVGPAVFGLAPLPPEKRVHLVPDAKALVVLAPAGDQVTVYRFDAVSALEKSGLDYVLITSEPPAAAYRGKTYRYQVQAKSKQKELQYRVETGPRGLEVSATGEVTWKVPSDYPVSAKAVSIVVSDKGGHEAAQHFKVHVQLAAPPGAKEGAEPGPALKKGPPAKGTEKQPARKAGPADSGARGNTPRERAIAGFLCGASPEGEMLAAILSCGLCQGRCLPRPWQTPPPGASGGAAAPWGAAPAGLCHAARASGGAPNAFRYTTPSHPPERKSAPQVSA